MTPAGGDIYFVGTTRPFNTDDIYSFKTIAAKVDDGTATNSLEDIYVVPNPYVVTNVIEPRDIQNPFDRGQRRLYFTNLPSQGTIRIFTITGELVETLEHDSPIENGQAFWDLTTRDNFPIAYGVYIYHVDAGSLGQVVKRFAVIK